MNIAQRNRALKALMVKAYAPHKVTVRGSRGTAYGWVTLKIDYAPRNGRERRELQAKVWELIRAAKIEIGTYDSGDYGSGSTIHIDFAPTREQADYWGQDAWKQELSDEVWDKL